MALLLLFFLFLSKTESATFTVTNNCKFTVWPGLLSGAGTDPLSTTGFALHPGESTSLPVAAAWSGRLWGRTHCSVDPATAKFSCLTGDCGSGAVECSGSGASPPATLAEFTLNGADNLDFYDVSLVDGYNLPVSVVPHGGDNCTSTGCVVNLNGACPAELKVIATARDGPIACRSACEAFGDPQYCCSGAYATPDTCKPSVYSEFFKSACPLAYSYAYDDGTSTFTCSSADYVITFCPAPTISQKLDGKNPEAVSVSSANRDRPLASIVGGVAVIIALWRQLFNGNLLEPTRRGGPCVVAKM